MVSVGTFGDSAVHMAKLGQINTPAIRDTRMLAVMKRHPHLAVNGRQQLTAGVDCIRGSRRWFLNPATTTRIPGTRPHSHMPLRTIILATTNPGKLREIRDVLGGLPLEVVSIASIDDIEAPEETGATFAENARLKAHYYASHTRMWCLADDSRPCCRRTWRPAGRS